MRDYKQEYQTRGETKRERKNPYAVDSTRGNSLINPLNYKGDVLVQVWVDSRVLATLCKWMDEKGNYSRFMSQAVRRPLEVLAEYLVESGEVEMVDNTADARRLLERRFNVDLNRGGRGEKNVNHNLALSDRRGELGERIRAERKVNDVSRPKSKFISPLTAEAVRIYNSLPVPSKSTLFEFERKTNVGDEKVVSAQKLNDMVSKQSDIEIPALRERSSQSELEERARLSRQVEKDEADKMDAYLASIEEKTV